MNTQQFLERARHYRGWIAAWIKGHPRVTGVTLLALLLLLFPLMSLWRQVDERLSQGVFANTANIYSAPHKVTKGDILTPERAVEWLKAAKYTDQRSNPLGYYVASGDRVEVHPGPDSYFNKEPAVIEFKKDRVARIADLNSGSESNAYLLEPRLIANLAGPEREKRRLLKYDEIPTLLVNAILSAEDKGFFTHLGFDSLRLIKAVLVNLQSGRKEQGGSTITMQLARNLWLDQGKTYRRKMAEFFITLILEMKLTKKEIFEHYTNQVYLGRRDTFNIHGFGEASRLFLNKDVEELNLPEAAMLAGLIQRPSVFDPVRHPEEARERRNIILLMMHRNGYITEPEYKSAAARPVTVSPVSISDEDAPYFLALARDEMEQHLGDKVDAKVSYNVYTTLDPDLQKAAVEAVRAGGEKLDKALKAEFGKEYPNLPTAQVALVALDPHTGEIKAVVGGRNYATSQLNHALSKRQPGSTFKPFAFAAALGAPLDEDPKKRTRITLATTLTDLPTTFKFGDELYQPGNYGDKYFGQVTLRTALNKSLNNATVNLAQKAGYRRILQVVRNSGFNKNIRATPSMALGSYESTPVELAGGYTIFATQGYYVEPTFLNEIRTAAGQVAFVAEPVRRQVLDPRVAYIMLDLMRDVTRVGTAASVASKLNAPAAGKTGTSRDGWFAGFTRNLLCVVWVGFDDNRELELEGSRSALPIWNEFMARAVTLGSYGGEFPKPPPGLVQVAVDIETGLLAPPGCPSSRTEYFISGTQPTTTGPCSGFELGDEEVLTTSTASALPPRPRGNR